MSCILFISEPIPKGEDGKPDPRPAPTPPKSYGPEGTVKAMRVFENREEAHKYAVRYAAKSDLLTELDTPAVAFHFVDATDGTVLFRVLTVPADE